MRAGVTLSDCVKLLEPLQSRLQVTSHQTRCHIASLMSQVVQCIQSQLAVNDVHSTVYNRMVIRPLRHISLCFEVQKPLSGDMHLCSRKRDWVRIVVDWLGIAQRSIASENMLVAYCHVTTCLLTRDMTCLLFSARLHCFCFKLVETIFFYILLCD